MRRNDRKRFMTAVLAVLLLLTGCCPGQIDLRATGSETSAYEQWTQNLLADEPVSYARIPEYSGSPYVILNENIPRFSEDAFVLSGYEYYSDLDELGRCGTAFAVVCQETLPTEKRGSIGHVRPTGWHTVKYENLIEDLYLYNRCHLLGYQLTAENDNVQNLITGTRYLNITGMLPFENEIAEFVQETDMHVLYRVTPVFVGNELVARGVEMEAKSIEDNGEGIQFHVFCYNIQPGIVIDYATGESCESASDLTDRLSFLDQISQFG